jgi:glycosyltransferase involved in cell wall biosynthesis
VTYKKQGFPKKTSVAIVHDWLVTAGGAEKVLQSLLKVFPQAVVYTIVDFLKPQDRAFLRKHKVHTSFIQKLPLANKYYRHYLPLMPLAIEQFDLSGYDLVISSSYAVAKGVITGPGQPHICYCHSPMRYAWDLQHQYLRESGLQKGIKSLLARFFLHKLRIWDVRSANGVDHFIANSNFVAERIHKFYRRHSSVIYPPVSFDSLQQQDLTDKTEFYLTASRLVPYKRIDLVVEAFNALPTKKLMVVGDGPEFKKISRIAKENITVLGRVSDDKLKQLLHSARAFIFPAEEDFGILPLEAQACGTPVLAYGKGGSLETVTGIYTGDPISENSTGVFFNEQNSVAITDAIHFFEKNEHLFTPYACVMKAKSFRESIFLDNTRNFCREILEQYKKTTLPDSTKPAKSSSEQDRIINLPI